MEIEINSYDDLLEFIKRDDVDVEFCSEVVQKFLKVLIIFKTNKIDLIQATESHIEKFGSIPAHWEQPLFLNQKELDFNIKDIFNTNV